jgi:hypothetical protein
MKIAPIVLFAFNRPQSLRNCTESLRKNALAKESELFIFVDGPRQGKEGDAKKVLAVQEVAKLVTGFKNVTLEFSEKNKGLANSIISGISQIIEKYGKAIVLEDDLIFASNFLDFINQGLEKYENEQKVFSVCGYGLKVKTSANYNSDAYFCTRSSSWGWATWKDRWHNVNWNINLETAKIHEKKFNRLCGSDCSRMLKKMIYGKISSWDILFVFSQFLQNKYSLFPVKSLVKNIGFNHEGTHIKSKYSRFKIDFDKSGKINFLFPEKIKLNGLLWKNVMKYHSISIRLWSRLMYLIY